MIVNKWRISKKPKDEIKLQTGPNLKLFSRYTRVVDLDH
jgi:hypothetical protein